MHTVKQILKLKDFQAVWSIAPESTVFEAIEMMADKKVGALLVMSATRLEGIISERDYAREVILKGRASRDTRVSEIMSTPAITIPSSSLVVAALELMTERRIRHLPVVDNKQVKGVVSIGDLVKDIISDQQSTIEQLQEYIRS